MKIKHPPMPRKTRTAALAEKRLHRDLERYGEDVYLWRELEEKIPKAWRTLEEDVDVEEERVKITLRVERSVAQFYRAMGKGYQDRINRVLRTYAQFSISRSSETWMELAVRFEDLKKSMPEDPREVTKEQLDRSIRIMAERSKRSTWD